MRRTRVASPAHRPMASGRGPATRACGSARRRGAGGGPPAQRQPEGYQPGAFASSLLIAGTLIAVCVVGILVHRALEQPLLTLARRLLKVRRLNPQMDRYIAPDLPRMATSALRVCDEDFFYKRAGERMDRAADELGAMRYWSVRPAPIWCIAISPVSALPRCPTRRPWSLGCSDGADRDPSVGHQCHRRKAATWATPCRYRPMDARNQPCPASTHCWSGWPGHGKRG